MNRFEPVNLSWDGESYTIPASRMMGALARIEDHITYHQLTQYASAGTAPIAKLAGAYAAILQYAGCLVTAEDVYIKMFGGEANTTSIAEAITTLLAMMMPPKSVVELLDGDKSSGNSRPAAGKRRASSRKRTSSRSARESG